MLAAGQAIVASGNYIETIRVSYCIVGQLLCLLSAHDYYLLQSVMRSSQSHPQRANKHLLMVVMAVTLLLIGCEQDHLQETLSQKPAAEGCLACHENNTDSNHHFDCQICHEGNADGQSAEAAHQNMIASPSHPSQAPQKCGSCHQELIEATTRSNHYQLAKHRIMVFNAFFGNTIPPPELANLRAFSAPQTPVQLVEDLLSRRCLRCHVYYQGDSFPATRRGQGCAACHLRYENQQLVSHSFAQPTDQQCLTCHYGNHVGSDYYGRFEHDFNEEYRTPYTTSAKHFRPYGVEHHQLSPDIHQTAGMVCLDCHQKNELMGTDPTRRTCESCHAPESLAHPPSPEISYRDERYWFSSESTGQTWQLPIMQNPAHTQYTKNYACQVCHAQWVFNDSQTHVLRVAHQELEPWAKLTLDGSSETYEILESYVHFEGEMMSPTMTHKLSGRRYPGMWLKGYRERRWERFLYVRDQQGKVQLGRTLLDLHLSAIDEHETRTFETLVPRATANKRTPYHPHTIGKAGVFYRERIRAAQLPELSQLQPNDTSKQK